MSKQFFLKIKESSLSILPIILLVIILNFTPLINLSFYELFAFIIASIIMIFGVSFFTLGAEMSMTPMAKSIGNGLTKKRKLFLLLVVAFIIGFLITIAEPDLSVLAYQVSEVINSTTLIIIVGIGVALLLALAIIKMVFKVKISTLLMFLYLFLFAIMALVVINGNDFFLAIAFDSGGVTTGAVTVPFIIALGIGIASSLGSKDSKENSFGLMALCSVGAIITVMIAGIFINSEMSYKLADYAISDNVFIIILINILQASKEVILPLGMIIVFFLICHFTFLKLPKKQLIKLAVGLVFTFVGLVLFLAAVNSIYISISFKIGSQIAELNEYLLIPIGFVIGCIIVLAEPAVHILNKEVEVTTNKTITKKSMLIALTIGVGIALALSMLRIIFNFSILYYLIPGYIISFTLSFFVPTIYTAVAFDSGGVAAGSLTSSFLLPLAIGACSIIGGETAILSSAFGIIAMVSMTPLITIQILGFSAIMKKRIKTNKALNNILNKDDKQIIDAM